MANGGRDEGERSPQEKNNDENGEGRRPRPGLRNAEGQNSRRFISLNSRSVSGSSSVGRCRNVESNLPARSRFGGTTFSAFFFANRAIRASSRLDIVPPRDLDRRIRDPES